MNRDRCNDFCLSIRHDSEKIRKDLTEQKDEERRTIVDELKKQKEKDLSIARNRINEFEEQVEQTNE